MADPQRDDVGFREAGRGITVVVLAAVGYMLVLLALAGLVSWVFRVM